MSTPAAIAASPAAAIEALVQKATSLQQQGAFAEARQVYQSILSRQPKHPTALLLMGAVSYQLGADSEARRWLDQALAVHREIARDFPLMKPPQAALANLLLACGHGTEAEGICRDLVWPLIPIRSDPAAFERRRREALAKGRPAILINTLPKSASESIWNRLAEGLDMPQAHVSIGFFPHCCLIDSRVRELARGALTAKEHIPATAHNLALLKAHGIRRMVFHLRDLRQAALSWAHFVRDDIGKRPMAAIWRDIVPPASVLSGPFEGLLDWCIDSYLPVTVRFVDDWLAVAAQPEAGLQILFLDFELFRRDPERYLAEVLAFHDLPADSFAHGQAARAQDVHYRKGAAEEWREALSLAQRERAWAAIPPTLAARFGWTP